MMARRLRLRGKTAKPFTEEKRCLAGWRMDGSAARLDVRLRLLVIHSNTLLINLLIQGN